MDFNPYATPKVEHPTTLVPNAAGARPLTLFGIAISGVLASVGFPDLDRLFRLVVDAEDKMHRLSIELPYAACCGVGRKGQ